MRICIVTIGIPAQLSAINRIASELVDRGCELTVLSGRRSAAWLLIPGCDFILFDQQTPTLYADNLAHLFRDTAVPERKFYSLDATAPLLTPLRRIEPDVVLVDSEMHIEQLQAEAAGFRVAALEHHVSPDRIRGVPPLSSHLIPSNSLRDRWRCFRMWKQLQRHRQNRPELQAHWTTLRSLCDNASRNFDQLADFGHWQPVRFRHIPVLRIAPRVLDFASITAVAPRYFSQHDQSAEVESKAAVGPELIDWIANRRRALVICTSGSLIHDTRFIHSFLELAKNRDDLDFLMANTLSEDIDGKPANVRCADFIPQQFALKHADLMISGAGIGTVIETVENNVPLIAISHGLLDQNGNAARVEYHGIGRRIANADIAPVRLTRAVECVDEECRARVGELRQRLRAEAEQSDLFAHLQDLTEGGK